MINRLIVTESYFWRLIVAESRTINMDSLRWSSRCRRTEPLCRSGLTESRGDGTRKTMLGRRKSPRRIPIQSRGLGGICVENWDPQKTAVRKLFTKIVPPVCCKGSLQAIGGICNEYGGELLRQPLQPIPASSCNVLFQECHQSAAKIQRRHWSGDHHWNSVSKCIFYSNRQSFFKKKYLWEPLVRFYKILV